MVQILLMRDLNIFCSTTANHRAVLRAVKTNGNAK